MISPIDGLYKKKTSNIVVLLGTGSSINRIDEKTWSEIFKHDTLALNNFIYHPTMIPKWNSLEIQTIDYDIMKARFEEKWELGWKDVCYIVREQEDSKAVKAIGHEDTSKIYQFEWISRGHGPHFGPQEIDSDFQVKSRTLYNSYKSRTTAMFHLLYVIKYDTIITYGIDGDSKYFWSSMDPIYGQVHFQYNDNHKPEEPHSTAPTKNYIIDFNTRHMLPKGREIFVGHKDTMLYPELRLWEGW